MKILEIAALSNGAHSNQIISCILETIPEGWAIIPDDMETPNFPFGEVDVEEIDGVMVVTKWTAGTLPEPEPIPAPEPTQLDIIEAQVTYTALMTDTLLPQEV